jgi:DNA-binding response OmpR family regulator
VPTTTCSSRTRCASWSPASGPGSGDRRAREVHVAGERIDLTAREYELLAFLASHPRQVFSREELLENVWGTRFQDPATVTEHVRRVRVKIESKPPGRKLLTTLRGMGYRFDP